MRFTADQGGAFHIVPVAAESREGYARTSFKHWVDVDADGCSARYEVLLEEAIEAPQVGPGCTLSGGRWYSYYDDIIVDRASALDVDHMVRAAAWTPREREAYADYLDARAPGRRHRPQ